jgi:hypothetical protein
MFDLSNIAGGGGDCGLGAKNYRKIRMLEKARPTGRALN